MLAADWLTSQTDEKTASSFFQAFFRPYVLFSLPFNQAQDLRRQASSGIQDLYLRLSLPEGWLVHRGRSVVRKICVCRAPQGGASRGCVRPHYADPDA